MEIHISVHKRVDVTRCGCNKKYENIGYGNNGHAPFGAMLQVSYYIGKF